MIYASLTILVCALVWWLLPRPHTRVLTYRVHANADATVAEWDNHDAEEVEEDVVKEEAAHRGMRRQRVVRMAAAYVRTKIALPKRSEANYLVVTRLVQEWLKDRGVRPSHQLAILPLAVELAFCPTAHDVEARDLAAAHAFTERERQFNASRIDPFGRGFWRRQLWGA